MASLWLIHHPLSSSIIWLYHKYYLINLALNRRSPCRLAAIIAIFIVALVGHKSCGQTEQPLVPNEIAVYGHIRTELWKPMFAIDKLISIKSRCLLSPTSWFRDRLSSKLHMVSAFGKHSRYTSSPSWPNRLLKTVTTLLTHRRYGSRALALSRRNYSLWYNPRNSSVFHLRLFEQQYHTGKMTQS